MPQHRCFRSKPFKYAELFSTSIARGTFKQSNSAENTWPVVFVHVHLNGKTNVLKAQQIMPERSV